MAITRTEEYNYAPEQIESHVRDAMTLVEKLDVPLDLREVAFSAAVNLFSAKQIVLQDTGAGVDLSQLRHGQGANHDLRG